MLLVENFVRENVRFLVVLNGTLPDNPLFTEALYLAIAEYGTRQKLRKYVLFGRIMTLCGLPSHTPPHGAYPYPGVRKPEPSEHIHYAVTTDWMRKRMEAWTPSNTYHVIPNRFLYPSLGSADARVSSCRSHAIPEDAYLVARCTRVVPQKSIERRPVPPGSTPTAACGGRQPSKGLSLS